MLVFCPPLRPKTLVLLLLKIACSVPVSLDVGGLLKAARCLRLK